MGLVYESGVTGASPLLIQLATPFNSGYAIVREWSAFGDNATGAGSRPVFFRPGTPGSSAGIIEPPISTRDGFTQTHYCTFSTTFVTPPSLPTVNVSNFLLPMRVRVVYPENGGFVLTNNDAVVLYAAASAGHSWTGRLVWEEM